MVESALGLSFNFSGYTRRRFLQAAGVSFLGSRLKPYEQQPAGLLETIPLPIPGLIAKRHRAQIKDVSDQVSPQFKNALAFQLSTEELLNGDLWIAGDKIGKSMASFLPFGINGEVDWLFYNGNSDRYYANLDQGDELFLPGTQPGLGFENTVSADGKILYIRYYPSPTDPLTLRKVYLLTDTNSNTKIVFANTRPRTTIPKERRPQPPQYLPSNPDAPDFEMKLSANGSRVLLSFFQEDDRRSYSVNLNDWTTQPIPIDNHLGYLSELDSRFDNLSADTNALAPNKSLVSSYDGTRFYAPYFEMYNHDSSAHSFGAITDLAMGKIQRVQWPFNYVPKTPICADDDLQSIAQLVHLGGRSDAPGTFGTAISTAESFYLLEGMSSNVYPFRWLKNGALRVSVKPFDIHYTDIKFEKVENPYQEVIQIGGQDVKVTNLPSKTDGLF